MRVHVIESGRLVGNETVMRGEGWSSVLRRRRPYEFPSQSFIVEHPEGPIAIDTGLSARVRLPRTQRRFAPAPVVDAEEEIGPRMQAMGLDLEVRKVVITHLDWDHAGGLEYFPNAEILVHRPEFRFASKLMGKVRYQSKKLWPSGFDPTLYDLDSEPYGPFPQSKALTASGDVRLVPIPGHSIAQVGVIVETHGAPVFFAADHVLRQDWFLEDYAAGRLLGLGALFFPKLAAETSRRIHAFVEETPTVFVPSHDADAPARLAAMQPLAI